MNKPLVRERSLAHQCGSRAISQQCAKNAKLNHRSDSSHAYAKNEHPLESPHGSNATENLCAAISRVPRPGKIPVVPSKPLDGLVSRAIANLPGVMRACEAIAADPLEAVRRAARSTLVAVITNGTVVLSPGKVGPLTSKPAIERKESLLKKIAGIDMLDLEIAENYPDLLIDAAARLEPTFGGINLEDIKAPDCLHFEEDLRERMNIPVFHDDQHGTEIIVAPAFSTNRRRR